MVLVLFRYRHAPIVRVCPAAHDYVGDLCVFDVFRNAASYRFEPPKPDVRFLRKRAGKHVPLQLADLLSVRPAEPVAAAANELTRLFSRPQPDSSAGREPHVVELANRVWCSVRSSVAC